MEKKILTEEQEKLLDILSKEDYFKKKYYLTGGTALSAFYLFHRISEDLDFFSEEEVQLRILENLIYKIKKELKLEKIDYRRYFGFHTFFLFFKKNKFLKVDFNYYPSPKIEKGIKYKNIFIDSSYDIAVNKVHTISMEPRARDFIDLYFLIKEKNYNIKRLILDAKAKFDWHIDPIHLGIQFLKAEKVSDYPKMIKKIEKKEWKNFFIQAARDLKKEIFK